MSPFYMSPLEKVLGAILMVVIFVLGVFGLSFFGLVELIEKIASLF